MTKLDNFTSLLQEEWWFTNKVVDIKANFPRFDNIWNWIMKFLYEGLNINYQIFQFYWIFYFEQGQRWCLLWSEKCRDFPISKGLKNGFVYNIIKTTFIYISIAPTALWCLAPAPASCLMSILFFTMQCYNHNKEKPLFLNLSFSNSKYFVNQFYHFSWKLSVCGCHYCVRVTLLKI